MRRSENCSGWASFRFIGAYPARHDIRFYSGDAPIRFLPCRRISIGSSGAIRTATELDHLRVFLNDGLLVGYAWPCIILLVAIIAMILYRAQRDHDEYLWLGILSLAFVIYALLENAFDSGLLPITLPLILLLGYTGWFCIVLNIEFVMRFTRIPRRWPIRIVQGLILIGPALNVSPSTSNLYAPALFIVSLAWMAVEIACFVSAYRRGVADSGLFLVPCMACNAFNLAWVVAWTFPAAVPWGPVFHFGLVGFAGNYLGSISFDLGILVVVLYHFIRVARDEARVPETGMPLGISTQVDYAETTLQLEPDDSITFLSDGVVEARREDGELFGFERTQAISNRSPQEIADAAQQFGQEDDITVLKLTLAPVRVFAQVANA